MSLLLPGLGFISGQTIGALIVLMSLKMFRTGFNLKDWGQLIILRLEKNLKNQAINQITKRPHYSLGLEH